MDQKDLHYTFKIKKNVYDLEWTKGVKYGDMRYQFEFENSKYSFELASLDKHFKWFDEYEDEAKKSFRSKDLFYQLMTMF